ncbi:uncharacterized protein VTP21DRAFT_3604 [Calcarisporiella thermophila]|uniref:uncharacterized protein n=1 Tax=Calcarisporiella thermophila TaxID=911321 RepID=UPI0037447F98
MRRAHFLLLLLITLTLFTATHAAIFDDILDGLVPKDGDGNNGGGNGGGDDGSNNGGGGNSSGGKPTAQPSQDTPPNASQQPDSKSPDSKPTATSAAEASSPSAAPPTPPPSPSSPAQPSPPASSASQVASPSRATSAPESNTAKASASATNILSLLTQLPPPSFTQSYGFVPAGTLMPGSRACKEYMNHCRDQTCMFSMYRAMCDENGVGHCECLGTNGGPFTKSLGLSVLGGVGSLAVAGLVAL